MTAIYHPKTRSITYWIRSGERYAQAHAGNLTEEGARLFLREHIIRTEVVQAFEVFKA